MRTTTFLAAIAAFSLIPSILGSLYRRQSVTQPAQNTTAPAINPLVDPPFCALRCMGETTTRFSCAPNDTSCLCFMPNFPIFLGECVEKSCVESEKASAIDFSEAFCLTIGVIIVIPTPGSNETTAASVAQIAPVAPAMDPATASRVLTTTAASITTPPTSVSATPTSTTVSSSSRR